MKKINVSCKYLLSESLHYPKNLLLACYQVETFIESLPDYIIVNSFSDYQPSYNVVKYVGERRYHITIITRIWDKTAVYIVEDDLNFFNKLEDSPEWAHVLDDRKHLKKGESPNPYIWNFETLKRNFENVDAIIGFQVQKQLS